TQPYMPTCYLSLHAALPIFRAVKLAREAREIAGEPVFIAGSVGPIGQQLGPIGRITVAQAAAAFEEQIAALLEGGADLLVLETLDRKSTRLNSSHLVISYAV